MKASVRITAPRRIGQRTSDRELSQAVAGLTALGDLKETLSQERALLYGVASAEEGDRFASCAWLR